MRRSLPGYRWLAGRPLHSRLLAVSEGAALVLDAVTGRGRHRVRSALHLHPDLPAGAVRVAALGADARRASAPLHEEFNVTREMAELFVEADSPLPWAGGWALLFDGDEGPFEAELRWEEGVLQASCRSAGFEVALHWRLAADDPDDVVRVSRPPPARDSAN